MLSQKAKYAIRALLFLSAEDGETPRKIREIAAAIQVPAPFLSKIMQELVAADIVSSVKGPGGGFYLTAKNKRTALIKVVEVTDSLESFNACGLGLNKCSDRKPCPVHREFQELREQLKQSFKKNTLLQLSAKIRSGEAYLA